MSSKQATRRAVAEWLGVSVSTIRNWEKRFQPWLEAEAGQFGKGKQQKIYSAADLAVFATIQRRLADGARLDEIVATLDEDIRGTTVPPWDAGEEQPPAASALMLLPERERAALVQYQQAREELAAASARLDAVVDERNRLVDELEAKQSMIDELRERAAAAEARAELLAGRRRFRWPWQKRDD